MRAACHNASLYRARRINPLYNARVGHPNPSDALAGFGAATRAWFTENFAAPSPVQQAGWPHLQKGSHALLLAPTGSGKTLAAFLACIDRLLHAGDAHSTGPRVLYVSPIKALAYDIERNLQAPLDGILQASAGDLQRLRVDVRTGDTSAKERRRQRTHPGDILITTPESLYLLLGSQARETLRTVETIIVDEIHAVASSKRGVHLSLSLERLDALGGRDVQRIGLSATQKPLERVAAFLGGDRPVQIVDCSAKPLLDLQIVMPVVDMQPAAEEASSERDPPGGDRGLWPAIFPRLVAMIEANTTTLIFCNSRRLAERLAQEINELAGQDLCRAHHGSVARSQRIAIEEALKEGKLRALVATSSLELGIDMNSVDLVIQIESPGSAARGLQRVGRAGHALDSRSHGIIVPKFRGDLLEATVVGQGMLAGDVDESKIPRNCLDVLAQQIVAMCSVETWHLDELSRVVRRSDCYATLSDQVLHAVLDMLSGHYPSDQLQHLRPRLRWDRQENTLEARPGAKMLSLVNGGTIPDRGLFAVHLGEGGPRIGELDEEMVYEARPGETFFLGASTWRILTITRDQVIVAPAPGESGKMPFWRGDGPGRSLELGRAIGAFCREYGERLASDAQRKQLHETFKLDDDAASNLLDYLGEQRMATGVLPTDRRIVIERFCDELGDWRLCILSPFGSRVHAPWAMAISSQIHARAQGQAQIQWTDEGITMHMPDSGGAPDLSLLLPRSDEIRQLIIGELASSALFASHFRENAARALLLPRQRPGQRSPLWLQRLRSQELLGVAQKYPSFPIIVETYRECMQDVFDMAGLIEVLQEIEKGSISVESVQTSSPSPFARSLVFSYIAAFLYEADAPAAERKASALSLDRGLLQELLGHENLRELLQPRAIADVHAELQCLTADRKARDADEVHDLLRRLGALDEAALVMRTQDEPREWLATLANSGRAARVRFGDRELWIACEQAARYRDAVGVHLPPGIPAVFLDPEPLAQRELALHFAACRAPFRAEELASYLQVDLAEANTLLRDLEDQGLLIGGEMTPARSGREFCHPQVLRRIRRRSLEILRGEIAPVSQARYAAFQFAEHGLVSPGLGLIALREAIDRMAALPMPWSEIESRILPARVRDYRGEMLDSLCASGEVVWIGAGALGSRDGKVRLLLRHRAAALLDTPTALPDSTSTLARRIDEELQEQGASFLTAIEWTRTGHTHEELVSALGELVWSGRITNDTLGFLRNLKTRARAPKAVIRQRIQRLSGRWDSVSSGAQATREEVLHARSQALLTCFSVVSRDLGSTIGGGYPDLARVLRLMEEQGKLRRGHFVDGFQGSQFARTGVVDRLRADVGQAALLVAASDPVSPWGAALPWPRGIGARRAGATLLCLAGQPICYLEAGRRKILSYVRDERLDQVLSQLAPALASERSWRLTHIDGVSARHSDLYQRFLDLDFRPEQDALVLERYR